MTNIVVEHTRSKQLNQLLIARGVDECNLLKVNANYDLLDALVKVNVDIKDTIQKPLLVKKQYEVAQNILCHPLKGRYVLGISSFPSDLRAKHMAAMIMRNAIIEKTKKNIKLDYPLWHKVYGNHKDELRDSKR